MSEKICDPTFYRLNCRCGFTSAFLSGSLSGPASGSISGSLSGPASAFMSGSIFGPASVFISGVNIYLASQDSLTSFIHISKIKPITLTPVKLAINIAPAFTVVKLLKDYSQKYFAQSI